MLTVDKPKLKKGLSYALKTSMLESALLQAEIDVCVHLNYWIPKSGYSIFEAHFWLPNENVDHERVYLRVGVVPSQQRKLYVFSKNNANKKNIPKGSLIEECQ